MSHAKEQFFSHLATCDQCQLIDSRADLSETEKHELIAEHAQDVYESMADRAWDEYKETHRLTF